MGGRAHRGHGRTRRERPGRSAPGFTLVEILIVVVILGILAAIVVPQFTSASEESQRASFASSLKQLVQQADLYRIRTGLFLPDASSGVWPGEWDGYVREQDYEGGTPIGGVWDTEFQDQGGVTSAVGVHFDGTGATRNDDFMNQVDALIDDGDVTTGSFQRLGAGRYYYVLAW